MTSPWSQDGFPVRLEWGRRGAQAAVERGDVLALVDVLRFTTTVATAAHHGIAVYPCRERGELEVLAGRGVEAGVHDREVPAKGRFSLSPLRYLDAEPGTEVALWSLNGAICAKAAEELPFVFAGALVNASAAARAAQTAAKEAGRGVTVLACGERWTTPNDDGELRFAVEDYLGAGAVINGISLPKSPEALVCEGAFLHLRSRLDETLWECGSGRELRDKELPGDVQHAARLDLYDIAPRLRNGCFRPL